MSITPGQSALPAHIRVQIEEPNSVTRVHFSNGVSVDVEHIGAMHSGYSSALLEFFGKYFKLKKADLRIDGYTYLKHVKARTVSILEPWTSPNESNGNALDMPEKSSRKPTKSSTPSKKRSTKTRKKRA